MLPNLVILGASKSGTSSLYHYLAQHPDIFMSGIKEPNFFALEDADLELNRPGDEEWYKRSVTSLDKYHSLFTDAKNESVVGEASPTYLHSDYAPRSTYRHIPDAKLVAILRDPADRAYSHYCHFRRTGQETESFRNALQLEQRRLNDGWFWPRYVKAGRYHEQITSYLDYFDSCNLKIYLFRDFVQNTEDVYEDITNFIGVDSEFKPDLSVRHNASGQPKNRLFHYLLSGSNPLAQALKPLVGERLRNLVVRLRNLNREPPEGMSRRERGYVIDELIEDIERLEVLLDRDLSSWKSI